MQQIYACDIYFAKTIHAQALGFTNWIMGFVYASSVEQAIEVATKWYNKTEQVAKVTAKLAIQQDPDTYTFVHQIVNIDQETLERIYDKRGYPISLRDKANRI